MILLRSETLPIQVPPASTKLDELAFYFLFSFYRGDGSADAAASQLSEDDIRDLGNILRGFSKADFHHFGKVRPAFYFFAFGFHQLAVHCTPTFLRIKAICVITNQNAFHFLC